jgi:uncharacterized protein
MTDAKTLEQIAENIARIAASLETLTEKKLPEHSGLGDADAYYWDESAGALVPVRHVNKVPLALLQGIDATAETLLRNTRQFALGHGANNALLWGARGMGKSSLVKAVHAEVSNELTAPHGLILVEVGREDLASLPRLMREISQAPERFIIFCDDLSFDRDETSYKSLKTILDGGLEGRPDNTLFYATSNRRHLMPRDMIENERSTAINPSEAVEEKISLSDRFGLWLGFHNCDQETYLTMVRRYVTHFGLDIGDDALRARAIEWAATRGARSGRVAIQFVRQLAGELGAAS